MPVHRRSFAALLVVATLVVAADATAQATAGRFTCWHPRSLASCRSWIVTEAAVEAPASSTTAGHLLVGGNGSGYVSADFETRLAFTAGVMINRGPARAFGATIASTCSDFPGRVEARYRRWLDSTHGADLSAGLARGVVRGVYDPDELRATGLTAAAGISGTYIGADVRLDLLRASSGRTARGLYVGVRTGARAAPIVSAAGFAAMIAVFALLVGDDY
jgi:hypothetical protein